jgi:hypothetical protein
MILPVPFIGELVVAAGEVEDAEERKLVGFAWLSAGDVLPNIAELCFVGINVELLSVWFFGSEDSGVQIELCFVEIAAYPGRVVGEWTMFHFGGDVGKRLAG